MPISISRANNQKADLQALRRQVQDQMREMQALMEQVGRALGEASPRPTPLDNIKEIIESSRDLRVANGKLSAHAVASAFGISLSQLAGWLGRSRQALSKTPDADSLQNALAFFERVARLRVVLSKDRFLKWLRMPNSQLEDDTPLELLGKGEGH